MIGKPALALARVVILNFVASDLVRVAFSRTAGPVARDRASAPAPVGDDLATTTGSKGVQASDRSFRPPSPIVPLAHNPSKQTLQLLKQLPPREKNKHRDYQNTTFFNI